MALEDDGGVIRCISSNGLDAESKLYFGPALLMKEKTD